MSSACLLLMKTSLERDRERGSPVVVVVAERVAQQIENDQLAEALQELDLPELHDPVVPDVQLELVLEASDALQRGDLVILQRELGQGAGQEGLTKATDAGDLVPAQV